MKTEHWGKKVHFPEVTDFGELFPKVSPWQKDAPRLWRFHFADAPFFDEQLGDGEAWQDGGSYLYTSGHTAMQAWTIEELSVDVLSFIAKEMLRISWDTFHFTINIWDDGRALICGSHGQIIGSRYLAIIDAATIPIFQEA